MRLLLPLLLGVLCACGEPPLSVEGRLPPRSPEARGLVLLVHGGGDSPEVWAVGAAEALRATLPQPAEWDVVALDWTEEAADRTAAAGQGRRLGTALGAWLASQQPPYEHVHVIAHSVGAFLADGLVRAFPRERTTGLHLTFLDPFVFEGLFSADYGARHFGEGADYADCYLGREDSVPFTDMPLEAAHTFDVTELVPRELSDRDKHWWPIELYLQTAHTGEPVPGVRLGAEWSGLPFSAPAAFPPRGRTVLQP